jgi:hypothetical protein
MEEEQLESISPKTIEKLVKRSKRGMDLEAISEDVSLAVMYVIAGLAIKANIERKEVKKIFRLKQKGNSLEEISAFRGVSMKKLLKILPSEEVSLEQIKPRISLKSDKGTKGTKGTKGKKGDKAEDSSTDDELFSIPEPDGPPQRSSQQYARANSGYQTQQSIPQQAYPPTGKQQQVQLQPQFSPTGTEAMMLSPHPGSLVYYQQPPQPSCPKCSSTNTPVSQTKFTMMAHVACCVLFWIGCIPCNYAPYCMSNFKEVVETCPKCQNVLSRRPAI